MMPMGVVYLSWLTVFFGEADDSAPVIDVEKSVDRCRHHFRRRLSVRE